MIRRRFRFVEGVFWAFMAGWLLLSGCAPEPLGRDRETDADVVVIGGGLGGLSAAVHLASGGLKVVLLEQHHKVGGSAVNFTRGDFTFDTSLHEMAGGGERGGGLCALLEKAGVAERVKMIPIKDLYRSVFPDLDFTLPADFTAAKWALQENWPEEKDPIDAYFERMREVAEDVLALRELYRQGPVSAAFVRALVPLRQRAFYTVRNRTLQSVLDEHFTDERLKAVLGQLWVYFGPPPSKLWAPLYLTAMYLYLTEGAWQVEGTSQALSDAYAARIGELGGRVCLGERAVGIDVEDGQVRAVRTERGKVFRTRYVVSNADPYQTFFKLLDKANVPEDYARRIRGLKPSNSLVGLYLGLDRPPESWNDKDYEFFHNPGYDADKLYADMMKARYRQGAVSFTLYGNLGDPIYAPPGKSVLVMHSYADADLWPKDPVRYRALKEQVADQLLSVAETYFPGIRGHVEVKEMITPPAITAFTLNETGSPYGFDLTPDQWEKLSNRSPVEGLYLAGAFVQPGHGMSAVQVSGYRAARLILDREGRP